MKYILYSYVLINRTLKYFAVGSCPADGVTLIQRVYGTQTLIEIVSAFPVDDAERVEHDHTARVRAGVH